MIVNADDFGLSDDHNAAIDTALREGLISSTSLMPNMPGFESAVELAYRGGYADRVGVHIVLTEGEPLTEGVRRSSQLCDDGGSFVPWRAERRMFTLGADSGAVTSELRAQVERCRRHGLSLPHLDSHHHVHNELALARIAIGLAKEFGIARVRIARNCGAGIGLAHRVYKTLLNGRLRVAGLARSRYFGNFDDLTHFSASRRSARSAGSFELMTHPVLDGQGLLVDAEFPTTPFHAVIREARRLADARLVS